MLGALVLIFIALIAGELICGAVIKSIKGGDPIYGKSGRATFNLLAGAVMHEIARIQMEVIDGYSWEGYLTDHEVFYYIMNYSGLVLFVLGIVGHIICIYEFIDSRSSNDKKNNFEEDTSDRIGDKLRGLDSLVDDKVKAEDSPAVDTEQADEPRADINRSEGGIFKLCPKCNTKQQADRRFCMNCEYDFTTDLSCGSCKKQFNDPTNENYIKKTGMCRYCYIDYCFYSGNKPKNYDS